jgi:hypothetical protein
MKTSTRKIKQKIRIISLHTQRVINSLFNLKLSGLGLILLITLSNSEILYASDNDGGNSSLSVVLAYFGAKPIDNNVYCSWQTMSETNSNYFIVEKAVNSKTFFALTTVPAAGTTTAPQKYLAIDSNVAGGIYFYRIRLINLDGTSTVYPPCKVIIPGIISGRHPLNESFLSKSFDGDADISDRTLIVESVFPNSFRESFNLHYTTMNKGVLTLRLTDCLGKIIREESLSSERGLNSYQYTDHSNLAPGLYYLTLTMDNETVVKRVFKE